MAGNRPFDINKFASAVLFFLEHAGEVPKTKLLKLLYFLDFDFYQRNGWSITGARYVALPRGPVPDGYEQLLKTLEEQGVIQSRPGYTGGYPTTFYDPLMRWSEDDISDLEEQLALEETAKRWRDATAAEMVIASHEDAPWWMAWTKSGARAGTPIRYDHVLLRD